MSLSDHNAHLLRFYRRARELHRDVISLADATTTECRVSNAPGPVVDAVLVLKKSRGYVEGARKEIDRALELLEKLGCMHCMKTEDNSIKGEVGAGYGTAGQKALIPDRNREPEKYARLMAALGHADDPVIRPSFSGVEALVTRLGEEGRQPPEGLDECRMIPKFTLTARAKSGVDLDRLADSVAESNDTMDQQAQDQYENQDNPF